MKKLVLLFSFLSVFVLFAQDEIWMRPNNGQLHEKVSYWIKVPGGDMFLEKTGFTYGFTSVGEHYHDAHGHAAVRLRPCAHHSQQPTLHTHDNTIALRALTFVFDNHPPRSLYAYLQSANGTVLPTGCAALIIAVLTRWAPRRPRRPHRLQAAWASRRSHFRARNTTIR